MGISVYDTKNYAQYNPLSIQEIWAPGQALRQQHDQLAEEYAQQELLGGAASLGLQEGVDKQALADNKAYMDALKQSADELSTKGFIDAGRRKNLYKLKQQYATTVLPIQNALKERNAAIQFDREMRAKDQTYESKFDPSKVAVTDYLKNNQAFNAKGISKGKMFEDTARDFSTLKNSVSQKYPDLVKTGVLGRLWTIVNSDIGVEEVAGFVANEAKSKNIDPAKLSAIGQQMHNIVENNLRKHGAYDFAGDDVNKISELRTGLANAAAYAINDPKFGTMDDPMALFDAQQQQQQPDGLMDEERYDPEYDKNEISRLNKLITSAVATPGTSEVQSLIASNKQIEGGNWFKPKSASQYNHNETSSARREIFDMGKSLGINPPAGKNGKMSSDQFKQYAVKVVEAQKELFKTANKMKTISNVSKDVVGGIVSNLMSKDSFKDIDGDDVKYDSKSMANITTDFNFKKGLFLNIPSEDGKIKKIKFDISDLNTPAITDAYTAIQRIDAGVPTQKDIDLIKKSGVETYGDYKNLVAKDIRTRMSLTPGVTTVKP